MNQLGRLDAVAATGLSTAPDATMDRLADLVARLLGAEVGLVSLVDDQRQFFPGQHGLPDPLSDLRETPLDQSVCRLVVESNDIVQIDHAATDSRWNTHGAHTVLGVESYLGVPLTDATGQVLGSLCALNITKRTWSDEDRQNLSDLAASTSSALQARIATTVAARASARLQLVADTSLVLQETLDVESLLVGLLEIVVPKLADRAAIMLSSNGEVPTRFVRRTSTPFVRTVVDPRDTDLDTFTALPDIVAVMERTRPYVVADPASVVLMREALAPNDPGHVDPSGSRGVLVVPVSSADEVLGVMLLVSAETREFSEIDIALASDIGRRAGASLSNARAFERERAIAIALQRNLLSALPEVDDVDLAAIYHPAVQGTEIGGDWYDVFHLPGGRFAATIGDVTGHNMDAAAAMSRVLVAVRCFAFDDREPADILHRLDEMAPHLLGGRLATCQYVVVEPPDGTAPPLWHVTIANAGHLPPVLVLPDGSATFVPVKPDPLIGISIADDEARSPLTLDVPSGSILVLYTDGLVERSREFIDIGLERLRSAVAGIGHATSMSDACESIIAANGPDGADDVALLCIRVGIAPRPS